MNTEVVSVSETDNVLEYDESEFDLESVSSTRKKLVTVI
jgi:hypothetical protein